MKSSEISVAGRGLRRTRRIVAKSAALVALCVVAMGQNGTCGMTPSNNNNGTNNNNTGTPVTVQIVPEDHIEGDPNAPLTVVEYADFQCPFCGRFARQELPTIRQQYIDTGMVRWVFRHFPLRNIHPQAESAHQASECANDQSMFEEYHDSLFSDQMLSSADLNQKADDLGLNTTTFENCRSGGGKASRVQQDVNSGAALGITGTPSFIVGDELIGGFQTAAELSEIIDRKLAGN